MEEAPSASFGRATVIEPQISLEKNYFSFYLTVEKQKSTTGSLILLGLHRQLHGPMDQSNLSIFSMTFLNHQDMLY